MTPSLKSSVAQLEAVNERRVLDGRAVLELPVLERTHPTMQTGGLELTLGNCIRCWVYKSKRSGLETGRIGIAKAAIVVLADTETKEGLGRVANALTSAKEFKEEDHEVALIFDGAGTRWIGELSEPDHKYNQHFESVKDNIEGACAYCARAFGVKDEVQGSGVELLGEFEGHPSLAKLVTQGYQVITF